MYILTQLYVTVSVNPGLHVHVQLQSMDNIHLYVQNTYMYIQSNKDDLESLTYTVKEVNALGRKPAFNVIAVCHPSHLSFVSDVFGKAFDTMETMYFADKSCKRKGKFN